MPDWHREVSCKLEKSKFSGEEREEISRELSDYLEDFCGDACSRGFDECTATQRAILQLHEDKKLAANLFRARREGNMNLNDRTKQFWLPVIVMLGASAALLVIFQVGASWAYRAYAPIEPGWNFVALMVNSRRHMAVAFMIYLAWLYTLPFLAALGAYWSRRAGGSLLARIVTGLSPLVLFSAIFCGPIRWELPPAHTFFPFSTSSLLFTWVVIPGAALLLGVLPCFWKSGVRVHDSAALARVS